MKNKRGKFIVIDGTDGSGKATQTKILVKKLKKERFKTRTVDFPRYYNNFFGKFIGECLAGKHGNFLEISPYIASILYAADRWESREKIESWLNKGYIVIADRYVSSNQIHQGGKIKNDKKRKEFLGWLEKLEYKIFKIPKPEAIIYLDIPLNITQKLLKVKGGNRKKKYLQGGKDLHENNAEHLQNAKNSAMKIIKNNNNWIYVNCIESGRLMSVGHIHNIIWEKIKKIIK